MSDPVKITSRDGIIRAILRRPERGNALDEASVELLIGALERATIDGTRGFVLEGEGRHFCTGFDISKSDGDAQLLHRFIRIELMLQLVYYAPFVTMAFAHGRTLGAGADLFVACDHRIASDDATFAFPGAAFGILLGTARLSERIGADATRNLVRTGEAIPTVEALRIGLANAKAAQGDRDASIARSIQSAIPPDALAGVYRLTRRADGDQSLADLVRSASRPGLKERLDAYRMRSKALSEARTGRSAQ